MAGGEAELETAYPDLDRWVTEFLSPLIRRRLGGSLTWCAEWVRHAEAISRLNALWQEWEAAAADGTMSNWWLYHCDPHLNALMSKDAGPFMACKPGDHRGLDPLPVTPSDRRLWRGSAFSNPR
jgi:hypothetical protein